MQRFFLRNTGNDLFINKKYIKIQIIYNEYIRTRDRSGVKIFTCDEAKSLLRVDIQGRRNRKGGVGLGIARPSTQ